MRWKDILEAAGVGRITKQNQTADVGPNELKKQAAKFGNKVDKDGRPPTLSKKVKGSKTNVLFNLGLAEDSTQEGKMIPNPANTFITKADTAYDHYKLGTNMANLKSVPKGANYDEPDVIIAPYAGKKEMKYLQKQLKRIGYDVQDAAGYHDTHFDDEPTGGEAPPQVKNFGPLGKIAVSKLKGVQKERSYTKLAKQLERVLEDDYAPLQIDRKGRVVNGHHRLDALRLTGAEYARVHMADAVVEDMLDESWLEENFADGKKKGKSRPGRVKKAGASCNGSVTSLRKKAKKYSGERAKMYHWCANMKSGKKK